MWIRPVAAMCSLLVLVGCSGGSIGGLDETAVVGAHFTGVVHGGQQPIVGAEIFLFAANTTGYGGNGLAASASNASISLLKSASNTTQDTNSSDATYNDYYVTTGTGGSFAITGDYTCIPGQQVYLYAQGGNPTYPSGSANSAIGLLAALGSCPSGDSFPSTTYVMVNEVSTIATAYALAGFATDALHVSTPERRWPRRVSPMPSSTSPTWRRSRPATPSRRPRQAMGRSHRPRSTHWPTSSPPASTRPAQLRATARRSSAT